MNRFRKFNPGTFQSDEEVIGQFVVRKHELAVITDILIGNINSPSCQHALIVAHRGRGKSMLLARTAAEIRTNPKLNEKMLPVVFMEENQEISSLSDFWLEALFHIAQECSSRYPEMARELHDSHAELSKQWRERWHQERVRAAVLDAADRLSCRLVLMVENLQSLCSSTNRDFGWELREVLQTEPRIILLASATSRFDELDDAKEPFFEMFRMISLKRLNARECSCLWSTIGGGEVSERGMRPLEILTGGNPRLLVIVASFSQHKSLSHLTEEIVSLVDEHTEYFRSHLLALSPTESRVYSAILDLWQFSTPSEIAGRARMDTRVVSTMLGRLISRGALAVEGKGKKRRYAAAEPLYCIYYKLRRSRDEAVIVENLIRFMSAFYSEEEKEEIFRIAALERRKFPGIRQGIDNAATRLPELERILSSFDQEEKYSEDISEAFAKQEYSKVIDFVDQAINRDLPILGPISQEFRFRTLLYKTEAHYARREWKEAIAVLDQALLVLDQVAVQFDKDQDQGIRQSIASTLHFKGEILESSGNLNLALEAYGNVVEKFGESEDDAVRVWSAIALKDMGNLHEKLKDFDSALAAWGEVIERFEPHSNAYISELVARALMSKGRVLGESGKSDLAISSFEEVISRYNNSDDERLLHWVSVAQHILAWISSISGDLEGALSACEEIVERSGATEDPKLGEYVLYTQILRTDILTKQGRIQEAQEVCREYERIAGALDYDLSQELNWRSRCAWIRILLAQQDIRAAVGMFAEMYEAFIPDNGVVIRTTVGFAIELIANGVPAQELIGILLDEEQKADWLVPLVVALRQISGETVKAPEEILQVASDILNCLQERATRASQKPSVNA
ncbi:MAG: AAA family ATPase [Gammaproteobacteria bacterium]|nr:AAA family ATPase [Gammaproteobacteria bacterium]